MGTLEELNPNIGDAALRKMLLATMVRQQEDSRSSSLAAAISELRTYLCSAHGECAVDVSLINSDGEISEVASILLRSLSAEEQQIGLLLACAICEVGRRPCTCDGGRTCEVKDVMILGFEGGAYDVECGALVRYDGKQRIQWGKAIRALNEGSL